MIKPLLVAFDFDHTVIEDNTDTVVRRLLKDRKLLAELKNVYATDGWTIYMGHIFQHLHNNGLKPGEIEDTISTIAPVNGFLPLLRKLHSKNAEIIVISDSNTFFINHWLRSQKLDEVVKEVFTNPAWFDDTGLLNIKMYHVQDWCNMCSKNICKGYILENYIKKRSEEGIDFERIAYVGDGSNDLCPILRLSDIDLAFPRAHYSLMKILDENKDNIEKVPKAQVIPWNDGTEIWKELIQRIIK